MTATQVVLLLHVAAGLIATAVWLRQEVQSGRIVRSGTVPSRVYRILERMRRRLFADSRDVRFTVLVRDQEDLLRPIARLGWGKPAVSSAVRFRTGEGLAGTAAAKSAGSILFATIDQAVGDEESRRRLHQDMFQLRPETAAGLSDQQLRAMNLIAVNLGWHEPVGVLCIDSLVPVNPDQAFWRDLREMSAALALEIEGVLWQPGRKTAGPIKEEVLSTGDGSRLTAIEFAA